MSRKGASSQSRLGLQLNANLLEMLALSVAESKKKKYFLSTLRNATFTSMESSSIKGNEPLGRANGVYLRQISAQEGKYLASSAPHV